MPHSRLASLNPSALRLGTLLLASIFFVSLAQAQQTTPKKAPHQNQRRDAKQPSQSTFVLVGAGDIAGCQDLSGALATAKLLDTIPGTIFAAGDLAYEKGSPEEFTNCYGKTWGRFKDRTMPMLGNHEYKTPGAVGYFHYWGDRAGPANKGYYSFDLGNWHVVALNTNCDAPGVGGCAKGSPQEEWLRKDLSEHPNSCIIAIGHHTLFSSGLSPSHALHPELKPFWEDLYAAHAELFLAGHEHSYERFAPQTPDGKADLQNGIREFVVGTGGRSHTPFGFGRPNSEVRDVSTYGVLKLTLEPHKYTWEFVPVEGGSFHDAGSAACHARAKLSTH